MVKVYLPMGYPLQSGNEFETVVYQGNLVRSYALPKDPRSNSQMFERRFLSDVSRMRSQAGTVARVALKANLGAKWGTVLYQLIKADSFGWWSSAVLEWETLTENERDLWREAAPYKVVFNDLGKIYFCLLRVIEGALNQFKMGRLGMPSFTGSDVSAISAWFLLNSSYVPKSFDIYYPSPYLHFFGEWVDTTVTYAGQSKPARYSVGDDSYFEFFGEFKSLDVRYQRSPVFGSGEGYLDGVLIATTTTYQYLGGSVIGTGWLPSKLRGFVYKPKPGGSILVVTVLPQ